MYDVYVEYFDGKSYLCKDVKYIEIPTSNGTKKISDNEIMTHNLYIHGQLFLHSDSKNYTLSCTNLKLIEVRKN